MRVVTDPLDDHKRPSDSFTKEWEEERGEKRYFLFSMKRKEELLLLWGLRGYSTSVTEVEYDISL